MRRKGFISSIYGAFCLHFKDSTPKDAQRSPILTGSILPESYPWGEVIGHSAGSIYNTIAPNDQWVRHMPQGWFGALLDITGNFGKSGINGFAYKGPFFTERSNNILHHNNSIERDIIETQWMPYIRLMQKSNALYSQQMLEVFKNLRPKK